MEPIRIDWWRPYVEPEGDQVTIASLRIVLVATIGMVAWGCKILGWL
ncbi:MAG: hypothetical protein V2A34_00250 [Lentisphaerota bacterium]